MAPRRVSSRVMNTILRLTQSVSQNDTPPQSGRSLASSGSLAYAENKAAQCAPVADGCIM